MNDNGRSFKANEPRPYEVTPHVLALTTRAADIPAEAPEAERLAASTQHVRTAWALFGQLVLDGLVDVNFADAMWAENVKLAVIGMADTLQTTYSV
jgi:hypothetical protein